ncbi:hypothetical protein JL722_6301 [Aureococcus anophagefferens]|nr:hypothetical protein JL722_6301 [Aureococcus anophagefferens]
MTAQFFVDDSATRFPLHQAAVACARAGADGMARTAALTTLLNVWRVDDDHVRRCVNREESVTAVCDAVVGVLVEEFGALAVKATKGPAGHLDGAATALEDLFFYAQDVFDLGDAHGPLAAALETRVAALAAAPAAALTRRGCRTPRGRPRRLADLTTAPPPPAALRRRVAAAAGRRRGRRRGAAVAAALLAFLATAGDRRVAATRVAAETLALLAPDADDARGATRAALAAALADDDAVDDAVEAELRSAAPAARRRGSGAWARRLAAAATTPPRESPTRRAGGGGRPRCAPLRPGPDARRARGAAGGRDGDGDDGDARFVRAALQ